MSAALILRPATGSYLVGCVVLVLGTLTRLWAAFFSPVSDGGWRAGAGVVAPLVYIFLKNKRGLWSRDATSPPPFRDAFGSASRSASSPTAASDSR
jgi:hypothetical protein